MYVDLISKTKKKKKKKKKKKHEGKNSWGEERNL
jgi:hypothetical protein